MSLSDNFKPNAKRIFRLVSTLHGLPPSIRVRVSTDKLAILASSALLIKKDSLICLKGFMLIFFTYNMFRIKFLPESSQNSIMVIYDLL
jgi:hypothetical protein